MCIRDSSYPKFHVVLPAGRKLGDYVRLNIDLRFVGTDGIWGDGLRVLINGNEYKPNTNGNEFCGGGDKWKREGIINLKDATTPPGFVVPESLGNLTEFDLAIGAYSGGAQFYIDNISMDYEVSGKGSTVINFEEDELNAVSYTHLDVYKRQAIRDVETSGERLLPYVLTGLHPCYLLI